MDRSTRLQKNSLSGSNLRRRSFQTARGIVTDIRRRQFSIALKPQMPKSIARTCREKSRSPPKANWIRLIFTRSSRQKKQRKTLGLDARHRRMIHRDPAYSLIATLGRHLSLRKNRKL